MIVKIFLKIRKTTKLHAICHYCLIPTILRLVYYIYMHSKIK